VTRASWQEQKGGATVEVHRIIEVATVLLLALATVGSAWCAYQVSQWNGKETDAARVSAAARIDGSREYALATQKVAYDAASVAQYAEAVVAENDRLQAFLRATIIRPEFLPVVDEWEAIIDETGEAPPNLVEDDEYLAGLFAESTAYDEAALAATLEGDEAGANADDYILTTLFMASALFFAGVTASFASRFTRIVLLSMSAVTLGVAGARIAGYPIA
jgi:hypothetical protein